MDWIGKQERPFFVFLPTTAAHAPFNVAKNYSKPYQGQRGRAVPNFFGMIANIDENVAKLDAFLEDRGLKENTILIFMTDNGTVRGHAVFNAGMRGRKTSQYDGGHRVPFFLRWPTGGYDKHRDVGTLAHSTDLLPSLIDLCGLKTRKGGAAFDGRSLRPLLEGKANALEDRKVVVQYRAEFKPWSGAVLWKKWRLVDGKELYDVAADPGQKKNIYDQHPDVVRTLRDHYQRWVTRVTPVMGQKNYVSVGTPREVTTWLSSCNWTGSYADNWGNLARQNTPGHWNLKVEAGGDYRVSMYMFHPEANVPLNGSLRAVPPRPVAQARLLVGGKATTVPTSPGDTHVTFDIRLKKGQRVALSGHFLDKAGKVLSGAFYTFLQRIGADSKTPSVLEYVSVAGIPRAAQKRIKSPAPNNTDAIPKDALLIADFEGDSYGDWKITGTAFGSRPSSTKDRVTGHRGRSLVDTYLVGESDEPTGTLTSPSFTIERKLLNFLIGGGKTPGKTCVNLVVDGKRVRTAVGSARKSRGRKIMRWVSWDVGELMGRQVQVEIVDRRSEGWGHIMVDHVFQSDRSMADIAAPGRRRNAERRDR